MGRDKNDNVPTSSIVTRAIDARTFAEIEAFVKDLEGRPMERLLRDLPELVVLPDAKVSIISHVITTRFRRADPESRAGILKNLNAIVEELPNGEAGERVQGIVERLKAF